MKSEHVLCALCIALAFTCLAFTYTSAVTEYSAIKPLIATIYPKASEIKAASFKFNVYNPTLNRYENCTIELANTGGQNVTVTVTVELFNAASPPAIIAYGQKPEHVRARGTTFTCIPLTWTGTFTLRDWAEARVTVS